MGNTSEEVAKVEEQQQQQAAAQHSVPMQTFPAFQPRQQGLLAEQMQAGYGGLLSDYQGQGGYQDMQVPVINRPSDIELYLAALEKEKQAGGANAASAPAAQAGGDGARLAGPDSPLYPAQSGEYQYGTNFFGR